jgi:hypothetical protein
MHWGDHRNGTQTWPRSGEDFRAFWAYQESEEILGKRVIEDEANLRRLADERRKAALRLADERRDETQKAALRLAQEAELRMSAATCREGDTHTTPGVTHARWDLIASGEDRRADRIRWWTSYKCEKCKASRTELTEWDDL